MGELDAVLERMFGEAVVALRAQADAVLEESNRHVPVGDPAADPDPSVSLAESGRVEMDVDRLRGRVVARIVYDAPYAVRQHESLHQRHPRGGGPKFLEHALLAQAAVMAPEIARAVSTVTRSGRGRRREV